MTHNEFAQLIDDYADGQLDEALWGQYFVAHYRDPAIEAARRDVVRISIAAPEGLSAAQVAQSQQ